MKGRKRKKRTKRVDVIPAGDRILALDTATNSGFAYGVAGRVISYGKYTPPDNDEGLGFRLFHFSEWLAKTINSLPEKPDIVVVEQPYFFRNAHTYSVLTSYVAVVQEGIYTLHKKECYFMTPKEVKQKLRLPSTKSHAQHKKNMIRKVNSLLGLNLKYSPDTKDKKKVSDDDAADAIGVLLAFWLKTGVIQDVEDVEV